MIMLYYVLFQGLDIKRVLRASCRKEERRGACRGDRGLRCFLFENSDNLAE